MPKVRVSFPCSLIGDVDFEVESDDFGIVSDKIDAETAKRACESGVMKIRLSKFTSSPDFTLATVYSICDDCGAFIRGVAECCDDCEAKRLKDHVERLDTEDAARSPNF